MATPLYNQYQAYQSKAVYVSSGAYDSDQVHPSGLRQLSRIQGMSYAFNYPLSDNPYLDAGIEPAYATPTSVDVTVNWYHTNGRNEWYLGLFELDSDGDPVLGLQEEKNLYITVEDHLGADAVGAPTGAAKSTIGLGQGLLTSYQMSAEVGGIIQSQATLNHLTAFVYTGCSGLRVPAVNHQNGEQLTGLFVIPDARSQYSPGLVSGYTENVAAIGAQDMIFMFPTNQPFGVTYTGDQRCYLQSFQLGMSIERQHFKPFGNVYPSARGVIFPIRVELTTEAIVNRYQADQLSRMSCTTTGHQINVIVKQPCTNLTMFGFYFTDMQVESQSFGNSIGPLDTVTTKWRGWITSPSQTQFSAIFNYIVRTDTTGAWGTNW